MEELEDSIQMWLESYNTYHLVDGAAMKEAWGSIMPHIMLSEKNLDAILNQVADVPTLSFPFPLFPCCAEWLVSTVPCLTYYLIASCSFHP